MKQSIESQLEARGWDYASGSGWESGERVYFARAWRTDYDPSSPHFGRSPDGSPTAHARGATEAEARQAVFAMAMQMDADRDAAQKKRAKRAAA